MGGGSLKFDEGGGGLESMHGGSIGVGGLKVEKNL